MDLFDFAREAHLHQQSKQKPAEPEGNDDGNASGIKPAAKLELNSCQTAALELLHSPENVFLTGVAGSGKSFLVRHFLKDLDRKEFPVLASTGAAAILVGGRTFHSFFGLGILQGGPEATIERALGNSRIVRRLKKVRGVIIDEVSMISEAALRVAEAIAREARDTEEPWGGLRVIAVGDFAQLPPVTQGGARDWAFQDITWEKTRFQTAVLKTIMRTSEPEFLEVLNQVRRGLVTPEVCRFLDARISVDLELFEGTRLFPHRATVERFNLERLERLEAPAHVFATEYFGEERFVEELKKNAPIPESLSLKEGALVMLRQNDPAQRWVNGSLGQVESITAKPAVIRVRLFETGREVEIEPVNFSLLNGDGVEVASASNYPLNLAYAATIHKAQGMTLDRVLVDLRHLWEPGQAYVALSRVKSAAGLQLAGWTPSSVRSDSAVARFYHSLL